MNEKPLFILSREEWSLHRKGHIDQERHKEKVKEAIKENLADIVSEESIIMSNGRKTIRVPVRSMEQYHFRYQTENQDQVGQGDGNSKEGQKLGNAPSNKQKNPGKGQGAGDQPGSDYYDAEITIDDLGDLIFDDLQLPYLKPKQNPEMTTEEMEFNDIRKKGIMGNLDKRRTILESMKRNLRNGTVAFSINEDDLRFKSWQEKAKPQSAAVVVAMMDTSGSMGTFEKYIARSFYFWMVRFLQTKYEKVQVVFIAHTTTAKVVNEEAFFTKGESGGTCCSSAYQLALEVLEQKFPEGLYNRYAFHFSDGDNFPNDNERSLNNMKQLVQSCNMVGYGEICGHNRDGKLMQEFTEIEQDTFVCAKIETKNDVYPALKSFFSKKGGDGDA
ncbi:MAG TPA: sporulation protein YhbH [Bacillales bacterium]|nr:sporulation protein YhbH [Bacillales bacterium]